MVRKTDPRILNLLYQGYGWVVTKNSFCNYIKYKRELNGG